MMKLSSPSLFIIHHSSLIISSWRNDEHILARPALRRARVTENPRLHGHRGCLVGAGHWREYSALQRRGCDAAEKTAGQRAGAVGDFQIALGARIQPRQLHRQ